MSARPRPAGWVSLQGQYAGSASRFLAYVIDLVVSTAAFTLAVAGVSFVIETITRHSITWTTGSGAVTTAVFVAWEFFYFGYSWAASGKTVGMAVLGIRVVQADGTGADAWRASCARWCSRSASCSWAWASSASWCSASTRPCTTSSPAPRSSTPGTRGRPGCGSWPARPRPGRRRRLSAPVERADRSGRDNEARPHGLATSLASDAHPVAPGPPRKEYFRELDVIRSSGRALTDQERIAMWARHDQYPA